MYGTMEKIMELLRKKQKYMDKPSFILIDRLKLKKKKTKIREDVCIVHLGNIQRKPKT